MGVGRVHPWVRSRLQISFSKCPINVVENLHIFMFSTVCNFTYLLYKSLVLSLCDRIDVYRVSLCDMDIIDVKLFDSAALFTCVHVLLASVGLSR